MNNMKMITGIKNCDECPYVNKEIDDELNGYNLATCFCHDNHCPTIEDSRIVDPNCPLEDMQEQTEVVKEEPTCKWYPCNADIIQGCNSRQCCDYTEPIEYKGITDEQFAKELNKRWANIDWSAIKYDRTKMIIWLREQLLKPQGGEK
jgi:hypothetical protein